MNIVTLTMNPTIDTGTEVEQVIVDRKLRCDRPRHEPGGGGINVTRAISKLGGESLAIYPAGGANGELLRQLMDKENIMHQRIEVDAMTRENFAVMEQSSENQFRFVMPGPQFSDMERDKILKVIRELDPFPDYVVASGSLPPDTPDDFYRRLGDIIGNKDGRFVLDTSGKPLKAAVEKEIFMIKPNLRELGELVGEPIEDESKMKAVAEDIIRNGKCRMVVISLGAGGAFLVSEHASEHIRSPTVPIKSKVGAGDSMVAGIVLGLSRGYDPTDAARFGVAAGAAAVMTPGSELCRKIDTERLFRSMNGK